MKQLRKFEQNLEFYFSDRTGYPYAKPYWIYISLSHKCTYNCQMCGVVKILKGYELPLDVIEKALDEISQWEKECVIVFTGGEIFLRKDIFDIFYQAKKRNITIEAVSNGALIDKVMAKKIMTSSLRNIAISLDGATEATHDIIREKGSFKKALEALAHLVKIKKELGSGPQISVWTTIMKENVKELADIMPLVKEIGVECLVYHPVIASQDDMQNTSSKAPFWIKGENLHILKSQIDRIGAFSKKSELVPFLHDPYLWIKYFEGTLDARPWKCNPFVFINIGPDGEVRSCGSAFGNIKEMSLNECFSTSQASKARKLMKKCKKPCLQTCWAHPESVTLELVVNEFIREVSIKNEPREHKRKMLEKAIALFSNYEKELQKGND